MANRSDFLYAGTQVAGCEDLLRNIFLRLPARCLIKLKCVSKYWFSFISDPNFARAHFSHQSIFTPSGLYFCNSPSKSRYVESVSLVDYDGPNQPSRNRVPSVDHALLGGAAGRIKILQSCHGLLLCKLTSEVTGCSAYYVCNPTTRKHKLVPRSPFLLPTENILSMSLAFDPSESFHYRIVCVKHVRPGSYLGGMTHHIDIYSSETGSWKTTYCYLYDFEAPRSENAFYWNDTIHWLRHKWSYQACLFDEFDVSAERMFVDHFPVKAGDGYRRTMRYFGQSKGRWHIIYTHGLSSRQFNVLEMGNETSKWFVKYRVCVYQLLCMFPEMVFRAGGEKYLDVGGDQAYAFSILSLVEGEKEEDAALILLIPGKVVSFKFMQKTAEVLQELSSNQVVDTSSFGLVNSYQFVDTLYPV